MSDRFTWQAEIMFDEIGTVGKDPANPYRETQVVVYFKQGWRPVYLFGKIADDFWEAYIAYLNEKEGIND